MGQFMRTAWLVMQKDLTIEIRSREIVSTTVFFAL
jgi:ABC-type transport system involved in cytochrome c biogenesis permease component